ncbi:MAG: quinol:cytochrome C oxidoreductase [Flavicella sp.]
MYQFSGKIKTVALALMIVGALGIISGFFMTPSSVAEVKEHLHNAHNAHGNHAQHAAPSHDNAHQDVHASEEVHKEIHDEAVHADAHANNASHGDADHKAAHVDVSHEDAHAEHVFHQLKNRPWAAFYVALLFFLGVTLLVMTFNGIQRVAQSGWSIVLFRVMEGISANLVPVSIIFLIFVALTVFHAHHLFVWMEPGVVDPTSDNYDALIHGKELWLNVPGWTIRAIIYILGWNAYRYYTRKYSLAQDNAGDLVNYYKNFKITVGFLAFFMFSESMMAWDWIMSLDPHWFSTLFGWYVLATFLVSAVTVIAMVTIYLYSRGHLPLVNDSHIHDLAKFMFGFSIFWTYLWFSQFMLIWYSDMPEETTYYMQRFEEFKLPFLLMVPMNFIFPVLLLINSDYKRIPNFLIGAGVVILCGHYLDLFVMIMPATVGGEWFIGVPEISSILFFTGIFIYAVFSTIAKAPLVAKGNPFLHESETFHY